MSEEKRRILIAEDNENLSQLLLDYIKGKGYDAHLAKNGQDAFDMFAELKPDLVLLDVMMPKKDGFTVAKEIREVNKTVPIVFLTAKSLQMDAVEGFESGADDYITKPFSMQELVLRFEAIFRRLSLDPNVEPERRNWTLGTIEFDADQRYLTYADGEKQRLTSKENELLQLLSQQQNKTLDRNFALKSIWGEQSKYTSRSMDVYITKLRKYLRPDERLEILNEHGKGYRFVVPL